MGGGRSESDTRNEILSTPVYKVAPLELYFTNVLVEASQLTAFIVILSMPEALFSSVVTHIHSSHVTNYAV